MAAAAAAGGVGAKLTGKSDEEALTSALLGGATAGLFGGVGSDIAAGGREAGRAATLQATQKKLIEGAIPAAMPTNLATAAGAQEFIKGGAKNVLAQSNIAEQIAANAAKMAEREAAQLISEQAVLSPLKGFVAAPGDVYGQITAKMAGEGGMSLGQALTQPETMKGLTGLLGREAGVNAMVDQMRADANRLPQGPEVAEAIDIYSQPYSMNLQGPFSQEDITGAYIGDNITPIDFYNQGYAKEGGSVQHMAQGGLAGLPVQMAFGGDLGKYIPSVAIINALMGKLGSDKKSVSPTTTHNYYGVGPDGNPIQLGNPMPQQMAFGGALGKLLGIGGGSGSYSPSSQGGPRGSSQGGKGSGFGKMFRKMIQSPEVIAALQQGQKQPEQRMERGGAVGTVKDWATELKNRFYGSQIMDPFMRMVGKDPSKYMAGGGMMDDIPPELLEMIKAQASAPAPKAYDQLAALGQNPMQQMQGGGLTGAAEASGAMMPALQPLLQVASEEALQAVNQPRTYAQTQSVQPFQAGGQPFEGQVRGRGDGMSDQVPFNIEGQQPALLSRDEYVVPADVVAMVGDGSSNAGANQFDNFIGDIRQMKYGRQVQPREINQGLGSLLGIA
jgi:hypothetical protein